MRLQLLDEVENSLKRCAMAEIMDLKARWEEDKAKVEKLKESRKFRPY